MLVRSALVALLVALTGAALQPPARAAAAGPVPSVTVLAEPADPVKWYRVRPSFNGEDEYLWEISERFLGDGDRLDEIFQLNKGRLQPDGKRLTVPDEIESGWVLQLPPTRRAQAWSSRRCPWRPPSRRRHRRPRRPRPRPPPRRPAARRGCP